MKITANELRGKKIGFFGLGKSNVSLLHSLPLEGCELILRSDDTVKRDTLPHKLTGCKIFDGKKSLTDITEDILFLSPSVRRDRRELSDALSRGVVLSSDAELFYCNNTSPLYAVTGSDGKSTTATLTQLILSRNTHTRLIGNAGVPMYESLRENCAAYVLELSSFMLTYSVPKSKRACLTNLTPNHLDWHKALEEYREAKLKLLRNSTEAVLPYDEEILQNFGTGSVFALTSYDVNFPELKQKYKAEVYITYESGAIHLNGERLIEASDLARREPYNVKNLMSAIAMTYGKATVNDIRSVAKKFMGLPHRCEHVGRFGGIDFYDSSIDSTPSRTRETLRALNKPCVLILGGKSKGVSYTELIDSMHLVEYAVICGENSEEIYRAIKGSVRSVTLDDFDSAVEFAAKLAEKCNTVLLSPASTSYDRFSNYKERGEHFKYTVKKLWK